MPTTKEGGHSCPGPNCGANVPGNIEYCPHCGTSQTFSTVPHVGPVTIPPSEETSQTFMPNRRARVSTFGSEQSSKDKAIENSLFKLMKDESVSDWHRRNRRGKLGMTDKIDPETGKSTGKIDYRTGYYSPDPTLFTPGQEVTTWPKHQGSSESARKRRGMENAVLKLMKQGTEDGSVPYGRMYGPQKFEPQAPDHDSANWPQDVADQQGYYPQDPLSWDPEWKNPEQESIGHESGPWMFSPEDLQYMEELHAKKEPTDFLGRTAEERFQQGGQRYNDGTMSPANYHDLPYEYLAGGAKSRSASETAAGKTHDDGNWLDEANTIKVRNPKWITNAIETGRGG